MPNASAEGREGRRRGWVGWLWRWLVLGGRSNAKWAAIAVLWAVSLLLGYCGFARYLDATGQDAAQFVFPPDDVEAMAKLEHDRWCAERRRAGWRHGPERDDDRKLHPDLVPWDALSEEAREKDRVMVRDLPAFLAKVGCQVERRRGE